MNSPLYLIQQSFSIKESVNYSVGLVVICLVLLLALWLPDILSKD
ncbi:MAG: hypothetical protein AAFO95_10215 [Cyanobacteria bacterium J06600_6]